MRRESHSYSAPDFRGKNLEWIKSGATGCIFSQIIAGKTEKETFPWRQYVIEEGISDIVDTHVGVAILDGTKRALSTKECDLFSILFPNISTPRDLARLVRYLGDNHPYFIKQVDTGRVSPSDPNDYCGIHLRIDMGKGKESWPMIVGPYDFFSPTRRAPVTELIFRNSTEKGNPTTPEEQIGIDDSMIGLSSGAFQLAYAKTVENAGKNRDGFSRILFRARVAVVVLKSDWNSTQLN